MPSRKYSFLVPIALGILLMVTAAALWPGSKASAQCGSQASSCKNCHETQGADPVNNDGTGWHQSHAFGDFCYLCHGGNNQSLDKDEAHAGMVPPLSDTQAACSSCHPDDLDARVKVYADSVGSVAAPAAGSAQTQQPAATAEPAIQGQTTPVAPEPAPAAAPVSTSSGAAGGATLPTNEPWSPGPAVPKDTTIKGPAVQAIPNSEMVDYTKPLSASAANWGNVLLVVLIVLMAFGGGAFVYWNERRLGTFGKSTAARKPAEPLAVPQIEGYSPEVLALLPAIAKLNPIGLHALERLLEDPDDAAELLAGLSRLDPELVRRIRKMDRETRAMLLALSGNS